MLPRPPLTRAAIAWRLVAVLLVFVAVYARAPGFSYVWDDVPTLRDSPAFDRPLAEALRLTQHQHLDASITQQRGMATEHESYRPLLFLTFATEVAVFGRSAHAMHADNVLLGMAAVLLAYALAARLFGDARAGLVVAAVFALHPLQVEPICYVSARADVLAGLLALASVLLVVRGAPVAWAAALLLASLLVKEAHVGLPLVLVAGAWLLGRRELLRPSLWLSGVIPAYALLRGLVLPGNAPAAVGQAGTALSGVFALPGLVLNYATLFVVPHDLSAVRPMRHGFLLAGGVMLVPCGFALARALRAGRPKGDLELAAFGLLWACVTVGPTAIVASITGVAADRYAYLPVFGFAVAAVALVRHVQGSLQPRVRRLLAGAAGAWGAACVGLAALQVGTWRNEATLWANAVEVEPASAKGHLCAGLVLAHAQHWAESVPEFEEALALDREAPTAPDLPAGDYALDSESARARNNLGVAYTNLGRLDDAARVLTSELRASGGTNFRAWYNLSSVQAKMGRREDACASLQQALALNPDLARAREDARVLCAPAGVPR